MNYPILDVIPSLRKTLGEKSIAILQAPPGAGKSTVLPMELLNETWLNQKAILILEPRRLAAKSVANRMAGQLNESLGRTVGYRIRFETNVSDATRIEVVTEGILTRMIQQDNALERVGLVIFDEFHERSLQADLALTLTLQVQKILRPDLRVLIMSATLDGEKISSALGGVPILTSTGKQFSVEFKYVTPDQKESLSIQMARSIRSALKETTGDILAFFPGAGEINRTADLLDKENVGAFLCPLYGDLPFAKQQEAILPLPDDKRKVVLATSIAETSLTIEGIKVVVDCGYSRVPRFDPRSGFNRLETVRITRDAADQRAGRAGRLSPGICYRLWSEAINHQLVANRNPEILDADLAPMMLELAQWGIDDVGQLDWITPPPVGAVKQALEILGQLDAIEDHRITPRGRKMLALPTHPRIAHMLLYAVDQESRLRGITSLACDLASLLEERDPLPKDAGADISLRIDALRKWRSGQSGRAEKNILDRLERLAANWRRILKVNVSNDSFLDHWLGALLAAAYPERIASQVLKHKERYKLTNGKMARLPDHDPLVRESWICIAQFDAGGNEGKIFLAAPLDQNDLRDLASEKENIRWDENAGRIVGTTDLRIGNLVLQSRPLNNIPDAKRISLLIDFVRSTGLRSVGWSDIQSQWQARVLSLRGWRTDESWPDVTDENLIRTLSNWLTPFLTKSFRKNDLLDLNLQEILETLLPWEKQRALDELAPDKIEVPTGSMIRIQYYADGQTPSLEVRLQEVFGMLETPTVNDRKMRIVMHLLSPGYKPVQVTQDLRSFWQTIYHEVRSELKRRYPKHSWPEDPWTAKAVRGVPKGGRR